MEKTDRPVQEIIRDELIHCGVSRDDYYAVKKQLYVDNFKVWKLLLPAAFLVYLAMLITVILLGRTPVIPVCASITAFLFGMMILFHFVLKPDGLAGQLLIYLAMAGLLLATLYTATANPTALTVSFLVVLVMLGVFMLDRPIYMVIFLGCAMVVSICAIWVNKNPDVAQFDTFNVVIYGLFGMGINIMYNHIRVREMVLRMKTEKQRDTDDLTGLMSRRAMIRAITERMEGPTERGILFIVDIDRFKKINDRFGHAEGDRVLNELGAFFPVCFGQEALCGRYGGDEFVAYLPDTGDMEDAVRRAKDLIHLANTRIHTPDRTDRVGLSIGIAKEDERDYDTLFMRADMALYQAKAGERNTCVVAEDDPVQI